MDNSKKHISIVSPVYGSPSLIAELCQRLHSSLGEITEDYEIILVFDCSPDNGWEKICLECERDQRVKGIKLSRNFGQHYAITAGLEQASAEWIVVMDCDLQDRPEEITNLYKKAQEGYDIVFAQRAERKDSFLKKLSSKAFYAVFSYMTDTHQDARIANFGIYHSKVVLAILSMRDYIRLFPTMAQWVGFDRTAIAVEHAERGEGKSNYSWKKLFKLAFDSMIEFSDKPLRLTVKFGMSICVVTTLISFYYLWRYVHSEIPVDGYTSLILSIWFLGSITIFLLGILGIYLGKNFDQAKERPTFIVKERENCE
jgi:polyisoprenyl-phosphate glycosyltransferase